MTRAAQTRQLAGLVIDGGVRDSQRLIALGFPVFSHGICIRGTGKDPLGAGSLYEPIRIGEVVIHHGDLILGDADGVVVIPREQIATVVDLAEARDAAEADIFERIARGETTMEIYRLP